MLILAVESVKQIAPELLLFLDEMVASGVTYVLYVVMNAFIICKLEVVSYFLKRKQLALRYNQTFRFRWKHL